MGDHTHTHTPYRFKYPTMKHIPQALIMIPEAETTDTLCWCASDLQGQVTGMGGWEPHVLETRGLLNRGLLATL